MFRSEKSWLGFALGLETVRVVQLTRTAGVTCVSRLARQPIDHEDPDDDGDMPLARALQRLRAQPWISQSKAAAALPASRVLVRCIELPAMSDVELAAAVGWEAERQLDIEQDEFRVDYAPLASEGGESRRVLVAAVRKDYADACTAAFHRARLDLTVLDAGQAALYNAFAVNYGVRDALLLDGDAHALTLHVVRHSLPLLTRSITGSHAAETTRAIDAALAESGVTRTSPVFVSGSAFRDASRLPALAERLSMTVERLNPLRHVLPARSLDLDEASASEFAVAIGAALRLGRT